MRGFIIFQKGLKAMHKITLIVMPNGTHVKNKRYRSGIVSPVWLQYQLKIFKVLAKAS